MRKIPKTPLYQTNLLISFFSKKIGNEVFMDFIKCWVNPRIMNFDGFQFLPFLFVSIEIGFCRNSLGNFCLIGWPNRHKRFMEPHVIFFRILVDHLSFIFNMLFDSFRNELFLINIFIFSELYASDLGEIKTCRRRRLNLPTDLTLGKRLHITELLLIHEKYVREKQFKILSILTIDHWLVLIPDWQQKFL